jgi:hypothetical protein
LLIDHRKEEANDDQKGHKENGGNVQVQKFLLNSRPKSLQPDRKQEVRENERARIVPGSLYLQKRS